MAFVIDKEELAPGLVIFRRGDVKHRMWYCRIKMPKADRYKTTSLNTTDIDAAKRRAFEQEANIRLRVKYDIPVFNSSFREVGRKYLFTQVARAQQGEISQERVCKVRAITEGALDRYVGSTQVHLIGDESWSGYPAWRRRTGAGRSMHNGVRKISDELAQALAAEEAQRLTKVRHSRGFRSLERIVPRVSEERMIPFISDSTIRFEMSIFRAVMSYAKRKGFVPARNNFEERPKLKNMRRDAFTEEECAQLRAVAPRWIAEANKPSSLWYRTIAYHMTLIAIDTGMRTAEMRNLRWRDVMLAKDRDGRDLVVLYVQGKSKSRQLVAPGRISDPIECIRALSKAPGPNDRIFTNLAGSPSKTLYGSLVAHLLKRANLRESWQGAPRSTYCFRHTYAAHRLHEGVDVYLLAQQMGTSVQMLERYYGHVDLVKHANHVLKGMETMAYDLHNDALSDFTTGLA